MRQTTHCRTWTTLRITSAVAFTTITLGFGFMALKQKPLVDESVITLASVKQDAKSDRERIAFMAVNCATGAYNWQRCANDGIQHLNKIDAKIADAEANVEHANHTFLTYALLATINGLLAIGSIAITLLMRRRP